MCCNHKSVDQEVDSGCDEVAVVQGVQDLVSGFVQLGLSEETGQNQLHLREVDAAKEDGDDGHDDVVGEALGDGGEGCADDGTNGQGHSVALDGKSLKLFPQRGLVFLAHIQRLPFLVQFLAGQQVCRPA